MSSTPSRSRRLRGCAIATLAYLATTALSVWLLKDLIADAPTSLRAMVSLLPVIPIAFAIREVLRLVRASDELQRRIDLEALATAALVVGLAGLSLGFLVSAQSLRDQGQHRPGLDVPGAVGHLRAGADPRAKALPVNNRVRELRGASGWSQAELAERLAVSRQTVNAIETGKYDPSLPLAFAIARLFGEAIEAIFTPEA